MKILLVGPYPPPHGGVSVHVADIERELIAAGVTCKVLDSNRASQSRVFCAELGRYALQGWTIHLHTNGHNRNSWLLALLCGMAGKLGGGCVLTLHSGLAPEYLSAEFPRRRKLAAFVCSLYTRVICVNTGIRDALDSLGVAKERLDVAPAYIGSLLPKASLDPALVSWLSRHQPLFSTALFFRPEYGFELLLDGLVRLRAKHSSLGCIVMGSGEQRTEAESLVHAAGLADSIRMLGDVDHETCLSLIAQSDVFLRTTLQDGDSISVREAIAEGVPVVASRVGTRPAGTILFQPGNVDEMVSAIEQAIDTGKPEAAAIQTGCMDQLMDVYRLTIPGGAYASA